MADEFDRMLIPSLFQDMFKISLGAAYKSFEMMKAPRKSTSKVFSEMKELVTIPSDAGKGVTEKTKALAAVWMEKGATWMEACKVAGNKFTEDAQSK